MSVSFEVFYRSNYDVPVPTIFNLTDTTHVEVFDRHRISELTCEYYKGEINAPLLQRLVNLSESVLIKRYSGYPLPQFVPGQKVTFDSFGDNVLKYLVNLPEHDNYWIRTSNYQYKYEDTDRIINDLFMVYGFKGIQITDPFEFNNLIPGIPCIACKVTLPNFDGLVKYCQANPNTKVHLLMAHFAGAVNLGLIADQIEELAMVMRGNEYQDYASQCVAIGRPITITFRLLYFNLKQINEFLELVSEVAITPIDGKYHLDTDDDNFRHFMSTLNRNRSRFHRRTIKAIFN